ncbi:hypothetical protein B0H14DRAFT_2621909 [Mycena olivaceomarginata]|nr:hypothetical protein B0H14DRAFT_2621909 [Mycena olivaceomarginata]
MTLEKQRNIKRTVSHTALPAPTRNCYTAALDWARMSSEYELERYLVGQHAQEDFKVPSLKIRIFSPPASEDSCEGPRLLTREKAAGPVKADASANRCSKTMETILSACIEFRASGFTKSKAVEPRAARYTLIWTRMRSVLYAMRSMPESHRGLNEYSRDESGRLAIISVSGLMYGHRGNPTHGQCSESRDKDQKNTTLTASRSLKAQYQQPGKEMEQHKNSKTRTNCVVALRYRAGSIYALRSPLIQVDGRGWIV